MGSIPFGLVLTRLAGHGDLRAIGSGNIGATNVLRTGRKGLAALTLLLDGGKGAAAVLVCGAWGAEAGFAAGLGAVLGHDFPSWLRFKGGKGVATTLGVLLAAVWPAGVAEAKAGLPDLALSRGAFPLFLVGRPGGADGGAVLRRLAGRRSGGGPGGGTGGRHHQIGLAIARHHANIRRLLRGTETRIGGRSSA